MAKYKGLQGVANNINASFMSPLNDEFHIVAGMYPYPGKFKKPIRIELLREHIEPKEINTPETLNAIKKYKKFFAREIKKLDVPLDEIASVKIEITFKATISSLFGKKIIDQRGKTVIAVKNKKKYTSKEN